MNKPLFKMLLACLFILTGWAVLGQMAQPGEKPAVIKAVAPKFYPPIARAARAGGKVVVNVRLSPAGEVTSAKVTSGHPLLQPVSLEAARRWVFSAAEKRDAERFLDLTFIYTEGARDEDGGTFFTPPFQVEIVSLPPVIN